MMASNRHTTGRLVIFISSTADLQKARDVVEKMLSELEIDGSRFELWPSSPNPPIVECLRGVEESDGLILLLGSRYGSIDKGSDLSITHLEYRRAKDLKKPRFGYILESPEREAAQVKFIEEVKNDLFIRFETPIESLGKEVKASLIQEFTRCFRQVHSYPPESPPPQIFHGTTGYQLPIDPKKAFAFLAELYKSNDDSAIHQVATDCEERFDKVPEIMNIVYMAEVNYGMQGGDADKDRVQRSIEFWGSFEAQRRYVRFSLDYNQGNALEVLSRHNEAIEKYWMSLKEMPKNAECWKNLGSAYLAVGDHGAARRCYEEALKLAPLLFEALYSLATLMLRHEKDPQSALSYLDRIIISRLPPDRLAAVQGWKAVAYMEMGRFPMGIAKAEDALAYAPSNWAWDLACRLYAMARQEDQSWLAPAESFWRRFLDKFPENSQGWAELGFVYWFLREQGNFKIGSQLALLAFNKALDLGFEDDGLVLDRIGHIYQDQGAWGEAEKWYRRAATQNPKAFGYCFGVSLIFLGRFEEALPWVQQAAEKYQPDAKSWFQVALCLGNLGRSDEAFATYQKAISLDPDYPEAWFNLGGLFWNEGNREQAKAIWTEAKTKFPGHPMGDRVDKLLD